MLLHNKIGKLQHIFSIRLLMLPTIIKNGNKLISLSGINSKKGKVGEKSLKH